MKNSEPAIGSALRVSVISGAVGFINGVLVILAGTSYFYWLSPYSWILGAMLLVVPIQVIDRAEYFLFRSGLQFILAPLLGALIGAVTGRLAARSHDSPAASLLVRAAVAGGIGGFVSLGIVYLNVYAS